MTDENKQALEAFPEKLSSGSYDDSDCYYYLNEYGETIRAALQPKPSVDVDWTDLMVDEFFRIKALFYQDESIRAKEVIQLCERAITNTKQRVPVINQRDAFEKEALNLRVKIYGLEDKLKQLTQPALQPKPSVDVEGLKPCPFCGEDARVFKEGRNHEGKPLFHVRCKRSRCEVRTPNKLDPKKAEKMWNTRAALQAPETVKREK